jgi:uncharacterized protein YkwD
MIQIALLTIMITAAPATGHGATSPITLDQIHCEQVTSGNVRLTRCTIRRQAKQSPTRVTPRFPLYWAPQQTEQELDIPLAELELPEDELDIPPTELELPEEGPFVPDPYYPAPAPPPPAPPSAAPPMSQRGASPEQGVLSLLNQERARRGLAPLRLDPQLAAVARAHSKDMCRRGYFDHRSPDGRSPWDRLKAAGIQFRAAAENIAVGYRSARAAHDGWMTSPGHRANRLNPGFTRMGVGLVTCQGQVPYWTEVFAR